MRTFIDCGYAADTNIDLSALQTDPVAWFTGQQQLRGDAWLLAYAEDGVIWGKLAGGELLLPQTAPHTALVAQTLLEARLFNEQGELHLWCTDGGFSACLVTETSSGHGAFDEVQRLWGTEADKKINPGSGFTLLVDGQEGLRHAVPIDVPNEAFRQSDSRYRPTILKTRHYFVVDPETGVTSIALSRLVSVKSESFDEYRERVKE